MRKLLVIGGTLAGVALAARRVRGLDMVARIEAMPDSAPPKWMFRNVAAIRANTERILEILGESADDPASRAAAGKVGRDA